MKKLLSLVLTIAMMLSLALPALAADATIGSTESGSNSASKNVTATYTPSTTTTDEAKWGASATDLNIGSGTLMEAMFYAKTDSNIKYIQLQKDINDSRDCSITAGAFTLDLNGYTRMTTLANAITVSGDSTDVTITDTSAGKTGGLKATDVWGKAISVRGGKLTVQCGSFTSTGDYALEVTGGTVAVQGGSYSSAAYTIGVWAGTLTVTGGSFTHGTSGASLAYVGGLLDLSGYPTEAKEGTTAITELTVYNNASNAVTVGNDTIKLPEGYAFYKVGDTNQTTVTELTAETTYGIKSTAPITPTTDEAKWGASVGSLTGSGTLAQAIAAAESNSSVKYIQLQNNVTTTSIYTITSGTFTFDLNGKTISGSDGVFNINYYLADVTFTDSATGGKVTSATGTPAITASQCELTITGGTYESTSGSAVQAMSGTVIIKGGSFSGSSLGDIAYSGGTLDFSSYPTTATTGTMALTELTVYSMVASATVGTDVKLPTGYAFYDSTDTSKTAVTTLGRGKTYAIKSTSGGTETETVAITGMAIKIGDTTYDSNSTSQSAPAKIGPDSTVTIVARGTNLNNATANNRVIEGPSIGDLSIVGWTCNADNTEATREKEASFFDTVINALQLQYSNDGGTTWIDSGVWIVYEDPNPPTITGVSVTVDGQTYTSGTVTITPNSGDVTITVKGTNLDRATTMNIIQCAWNDVGRKVMNMATDSDGNRYITLSPTEFTSNTTAFNVSYSNSGATTTSDIYIVYQAEIISVGITWGSLSFNYSDEQESGADKGWSPAADGANTVTVANAGTASVKAEVSFTRSTTATNITNVSGTFNKNSATLAKDASETFTLTLSGKPDGALNGATIGTVTVTISKATGAEASG